MLTFERVDYNSYPRLKEYFKMDNCRFATAGANITCDLVVGTTFLWRDFYKTEYAVCGDTLICKIKNGNVVMYSSPLGENDIPKMLSDLKEYCHSRGEAIYFCFVPEFDLRYFNECFDVVFITEEFDWFDYVYDKNSLAELSGRQYHRQKNHVNKFAKTNPDALFVPINSDNASRVLEYAYKWHLKYSDSSEMSNAEAAAIRDLLLNWDLHPEFSGGFIDSSDEIMGFTVGEAVGDTVYIHIEKADHERDGAYQFLASAYLKTITDENVKFVNREEDMGIPGLRKSKMSLHPVKLLKKYTLYCC